MKYPEESKASFIVCVFSMLGKIAEADGAVSPAEVAKVERYISEELQLDAKTRLLALQVFHEAVTSGMEMRDYAEKFQSTFPDKLRLIDRVVQILLEVATADGNFSEEEDSELRSAAILLGMSDPGYQRLKEKHLGYRFKDLVVPKR